MYVINFYIYLYMNIFVSGLNHNVTDDDLNKMFEEFGDVISAVVIKDKFSHKSKGFGFVEMYDDADGTKAIERLNMSNFKGKVISVKVAKPRT